MIPHRDAISGRAVESGGGGTAPLSPVLAWATLTPLRITNPLAHRHNIWHVNELRRSSGLCLTNASLDSPSRGTPRGRNPGGARLIAGSTSHIPKPKSMRFLVPKRVATST